MIFDRLFAGSFDTKSGITQHVRNVHDRVGEVVCHICAKVYSSKVRLRVHLMEHSGVERPRAFCDICGNSFKSEETRDRHVKVHQEQSVKCPHCDKISPNKNALKSHIVSVHSKPTLECHFCVKKFKNRLALKVSKLMNSILMKFHGKCNGSSVFIGTCGNAHRRRLVSMQLLSAKVQISFQFVSALQGRSSG